MKRILYLTALPLLTALAIAPEAPSQRAVEDALPASSYAVVRFGGLEQAIRVGESLGLVQLGRGLMERGAEEMFRQQVIPVIQQAANELREQVSQMGLSAGDLRGLLSRPMALGIGRLTLFGSEMVPSVALVVDVGDRAEEIQRIFGTLEAILVQTGPDIEVEEQDLDGHRARVLSAAEEPGNVVMGRVGDFLLVTNSRGYFRDCARVIDGKAPSNRTLASVRENLPEPAMLSAYLNTAPFLSVVDPFLPYEASEIGDAIGINGLNGVYLGVSGTEKGGSAEVVHLGLTGSDRGILRAPIAGPVSLEAARYCSEDTVVFGAAALDPSAFLDACERLFQLLPRDVRQEVHDELTRELGRELSQAGMSMEHLEGLLRAFGPSLSFALNVPQQLPIPELLAFLEVSNPQAIEPLLQAIVDESDLEWRTTTSREIEIYYANVMVEGVMLSPCFAFNDGMLIFSSHVRNLKAALGQREREESLATQDSFRQLEEDAGDATALVHVRGNKMIDLMWPLAEGQMRMFFDGEGRQMGLNSDIVPEVEDVSRALGTASLSLHINEGGVFLKQESNTGPGALLAGAAMFLDAVLQTAQGRVF